MKKIKRIFLIFISVYIFGITIYSDYQEVKAVDIPTAFWGTLEASRAFWTALQAGGGVRGGGVSFASFEHSSREDMHDLQIQVMIAYTAFCIWKEKAQLKIDHPDWSEDEVNQQAEINGRLASDRFQNSAVNVNDTTKNLTIKDFGYWKEFCDSFYNISKNPQGIGGSGSIDANTVVNPYFVNISNNAISANTKSNIGGNTFVYNGKNYIFKGVHPTNKNKLVELEYGGYIYANDRIRIPFIAIFLQGGVVYAYVQFVDVNILSQAIITIGSYQGPAFYGNLQDMINSINNTTFPTICGNNLNEINNYVNTNGYEILSVSAGGDELNEYEELLQNALDSTEAGKAIKDGVENGQEEIIKSGEIPVKRSSVRTGEETATGEVGWDVPVARTLEGAIAMPDTQDDVVEGMGIISVPEDVVTPKDDDTVAEWAKDEPISIPDTRDEPISKPIDDVISEQGGEYYPTQISLADFFPFCIPFDIYYCVQKFNVGQGEAPIIHIPIVYPRALQGALGESYDVIIDFNNYIALRNIIRVFILIFFLIGLMQVTRNLIRG